MSLTLLMEEVGDNADLLTRSDTWLEHERRTIASRMNQDATELRTILIAQRVKRHLQQRNLVAVQQILKTEDGNICDIIIKLLTLPDAIVMLSKSEKSKPNNEAILRQLDAWNRDGYDLEASAALRK